MTYNVQLSVIVRGSGLRGPQYEFVRVEDGNEIPYTPIGGTAESPSYILTDNGKYRIYSNGYRAREIVIDGLVMPEKVWREIYARQKKDTVRNWDNTANEKNSTGYCLNYPYQVSEDYPYFLARFAHLEGERVKFSDLSFFNARMIDSWQTATYELFIFEPIDPALVAVVEWKSVICIVTNYEQPPRRRR